MKVPVACSHSTSSSSHPSCDLGTKARLLVSHFANHTWNDSWVCWTHWCCRPGDYEGCVNWWNGRRMMPQVHYPLVRIIKHEFTIMKNHHQQACLVVIINPYQVPVFKNNQKSASKYDHEFKIWSNNYPQTSSNIKLLLPVATTDLSILTGS